MGNLFTSSIGKKLIMSITGAFLLLFLLFHVSMNIAAIFSASAYNAICEFLGANWYAIAGTLLIAAGVALHFIYASYLTLLNLSARGKQRYAVSASPKGVDWASRNMYILGAVIILGMVLHLYNFWWNMQLAELTGNHDAIGPHDGAGRIAALFSSPVYCVIYLAWFVAIWLHLTHGVWSMMQTVGWANKTWYPRLKCVSNILATLICLGFAAVVIVFYLRSIGVCWAGSCM